MRKHTQKFGKPIDHAQIRGVVARPLFLFISSAFDMPKFFENRSLTSFSVRDKGIEIEEASYERLVGRYRSCAV